MKHYNVSANRYNDGYAGQAAGTRARLHGRRVNGYKYNEFFPKKTDRPFSNPYPCTRLLAYTRARVRIPRVPGTDTRIRIVPDGF
jgi:hypothetical protein